MQALCTGTDVCNRGAASTGNLYYTCRAATVADGGTAEGGSSGGDAGSDAGGD
jgi:hypothetical protein